jgi:hypothetical protein
MWTGLAVCALLLIVDVTSVWWEASWVSRQRDRVVFVGGGRILAVWIGYELLEPGWNVRARSQDIQWWPGIYTNPGDPSTLVEIPLWIPLVAVAIPTGLLWRRNRRPSPRYCPSCRYNLTGNVSGVCPECGEKV